jgi:hypothetical protein
VIPADRKWFARIAAGAVIVNALMEIDPRFPVVSDAARKDLLEVKKELEAEAPKGAAADPFEQEQKLEEGSGKLDGKAPAATTTEAEV